MLTCNSNHLLRGLFSTLLRHHLLWKEWFEQACCVQPRHGPFGVYFYLAPALLCLQKIPRCSEMRGAWRVEAGLIEWLDHCGVLILLWCQGRKVHSLSVQSMRPDAVKYIFSPVIESILCLHLSIDLASRWWWSHDASISLGSRWRSDSCSCTFRAENRLNPIILTWWESICPFQPIFSHFCMTQFFRLTWNIISYRELMFSFHFVCLFFFFLVHFIFYMSSCYQVKLWVL